MGSESLNLGHRVVSSVSIGTSGDGCGPKESAATRQVVDSPSCHMAALVKTRGHPQPERWARNGEGGAQAQLAPGKTNSCKTSCFHFLFSGGVTCNSLELIFIKPSNMI